MQRIVCLPDVRHHIRRICAVFDDRTDHAGNAGRFGIAEHFRACLRQIAFPQDPAADGIVDIMIDICDAVGKADDVAFSGRGDHIGMAEDAVPHLFGEIQSFAAFFDIFHHAHALLIVLIAARTDAVQCGFACVPEGGVPEVMPQCDRFGEIFIEPQRPCHRAGDLCHFQRMRQAGAVMVADGREKHLRFALEPPERCAMQDAVTVTLEFCPQRTKRFRMIPHGFCGTACKRTLHHRFKGFCLFPDCQNDHPTFSGICFASSANIYSKRGEKSSFSRCFFIFL